MAKGRRIGGVFDGELIRIFRNWRLVDVIFTVNSNAWPFGAILMRNNHTIHSSLSFPFTWGGEEGRSLRT
jgi:hypothetical protein